MLVEMNKNHKTLANKYPNIANGTIHFPSNDLRNRVFDTNFIVFSTISSKENMLKYLAELLPKEQYTTCINVIGADDMKTVNKELSNFILRLRNIHQTFYSHNKGIAIITHGLNTNVMKQLSKITKIKYSNIAVTNPDNNDRPLSTNNKPYIRILGITNIDDNKFHSETKKFILNPKPSNRLKITQTCVEDKYSLNQDHTDYVFITKVGNNIRIKEIV